MTNDQKRLLEPYAMLMAGIDERIQFLTDEEIDEHIAACTSVSSTNCWCYIYDAAPVVLRICEREKRARANKQPQPSSGSQQS